jgi:hypothetical protein
VILLNTIDRELPDDRMTFINPLTKKPVESNGCLAVKPKIPKMSYAEAARVSDVVTAQDKLIANGYDPTTSLDRLATTGPNRSKANDEKPITGLVNLDIKKK